MSLMLFGTIFSRCQAAEMILAVLWRCDYYPRHVVSDQSHTCPAPLADCPRACHVYAHVHASPVGIALNLRFASFKQAGPPHRKSGFLLLEGEKHEHFDYDVYPLR